MSFGVVTGLPVGNPKNRFPVADRESRVISSPKSPDLLWTPPSHYPMSTGSFSVGVKRPGREADHARTFSAVFKSAEYFCSPICRRAIHVDNLYLSSTYFKAEQGFTWEYMLRKTELRYNKTRIVHGDHHTVT
jgi:hypothetical protein